MELTAYLQRIEWNGTLKADLESLLRLHLQHATHIAFENLDIQLGRPIVLDLDHLENKLIARQRGGYCFEQNHLFQAVLREIGFSVTACEARVRMGCETLMPRTHMLLLVGLSEGDFLCDVGFGGEGLLYPVRMDGEPHQQFLWTYRVVKEGPLRVLQSKVKESWIDLYVVDPTGCAPIDFLVANWYTSTHPNSRFVTTLTAQLPLPDARHILRNRSYTIDRLTTLEMRELKSRSELLQLLSSVFGLSFPAETKFQNPVFG